MKLNTCLILLIILNICMSCSESNQSKNTKIIVPPPASGTIEKPGSSYSDTLDITNMAAVFYNPDSLQLISINKVNTASVYESLMHDCFYQMRHAKQALTQSWPAIKIIETSKARYLRFHFKNGNTETIDLNKKNDICGIFLFNKIQSPVLADMMNIETMLDTYFR